ncbi:hypothetical protein BPLS_P6320 [Bathymodiolus platifrons methanotrophic gill symbiont]|nr:hypothetical protein BPLS_P6320 [Bathymodiolus platifrons methanotrophic gill symbiont]
MLFKKKTTMYIDCLSVTCQTTLINNIKRANQVAVNFGNGAMNYKTYAAAHEAAQKIREQHLANGIMVKIESSAYGSYILKLIPVDLLIDNLANDQRKNSSKPVLCA